jgi:YgiT-type zinc finger domain-containing protein
MGRWFFEEEKIMVCPVCKNGESSRGNTTLVFERGTSTIVIRKVPADVCDNCGEAFLSEDISREVMKMAGESVSKGIEVEIMNYAA